MSETSNERMSERAGEQTRRMPVSEQRHNQTHGFDFLSSSLVAFSNIRHRLGLSHDLRVIVRGGTPTPS